MPNDQQYIAKLEQVSKIYGDHRVTALAGVSLNVSRGEFVAIMGASGCGKSTLLNLLGGIDRQSSGSIEIDGQVIDKFTDEQLTRLRAEKIGYVFQFFNLLSTLSVRENVALPLELYGKIGYREKKDRVAELLNRVDMNKRADFFPSQLSGGEMQRVAIARALVHRPRLILADEPTGNLDSENGANILDLLKNIHSDQSSPTVIMATHSETAAACADRIIKMKDGSILEENQICPRA